MRDTLQPRPPHAPPRFKPNDRIAVMVRPLMEDATAVAHFRISEAAPMYVGRNLYRASSSGLDPAPEWLGTGGGDFLLRCFPWSERAVALQTARWQALIRRAAGHLLGAEHLVAEPRGVILAPGLHLCGLLQTWVEGRPWRLEMDDRIFARRRPDRVPDYRSPSDFPSEFSAKRFFMARFARLLREMGAANLSRRYDGSWLSPLQVLKRQDGDENPYTSLVAWAFPFPGCDPQALADFVEQHREAFDGLEETAGRLRFPVAPADVGFPGECHPAPAAAATPEAAGAGDISLKDVLSIVFKPAVRDRWLLSQVRQGRQSGMLSAAEEDKIVSQIPDPFIQLYLKCLVVHLGMLPVTNVVVVAGGAWYAWSHHLPWSEGIKMILLGLAFFAVFPISPGSLARGLFVVFVAWRQKHLRRLRTALLLSFWRYVGYMAFPIQMVTTFPALSRFMAARWATETVHAIPVAGHPGGLLEHLVFDMFFNIPISLGRSWREWRSRRKHT